MKHIKKKALSLVKKYKTNDPFRIASFYKSIFVYEYSLNLSVKGIYFYDNKTKFICLNSETDFITQRATCAHELGHAFFHPHINSFYLSQNDTYLLSLLEQQADVFAAELLISDETMLRLNYLPDDQIALLCNVPISIVTLKRHLLF